MRSFPPAWLWLLALWSAVAHAGGADFSGRWTLDEARSTSMDPVLTLQGVPWAKRVLAADLDAKVGISQRAEGLTVTIDNLLGTHEQHLVFDGKPHPTVNPAGVATTFSTSWEGEVLVATGRMDGEGLESTLTERRSLSADGQTMTVDLLFRDGDGQTASARRVFDKN